MKNALNLRSIFLLFAFLTGILLACNNESQQTTTTTDSTNADSIKNQPATGATAEAAITATKSDTTVTGTATFTEDNGKVKLELNITAPQMANRSVAVHLHEHGDCGDAGKASHGHWNPGNKQHGKWGEGEFHAGDIGNVTLDAQGKGTTTLETDLWSIGGEPTKDILGKAVIVHSGVDDFKTQPTGNAGSRIGCGVIQKK
jgi:superoxide dismutase, Cu-Zn family